MSEKVSLAACNGMSKCGLISRVVASDLSEDESNIISICLSSTAASDKNPSLLNKYPIIALNGCSNSCVNKILENKGIHVDKMIDIMVFVNKNDLKTGEVARLTKDSEKTVNKLKEHILNNFI